ncbi:MAG TPA: hypothetical protein VGR76_09010, partial [Candidatus Angelobacter sp.]|nr:hypothetical protein [Candidatus Angelobacter sp.]
MPLDSDTPNADAQLQVTFYEYKEDGPWKGVPHVRIMTPGDKTSIIDRPARDDDKRRFQRQWLHFQMKSTDMQVIGTPLSQWRQDRPDEISQGQLEELFILKFMSVEQVAMASDTQVQRVGIGAAGLRERARSYLSAKNAQASGAELAALKAENEAMKAQMAALMTAIQNQLAPQEPPAKKQMGWPRGKKRGRKSK